MKEIKQLNRKSRLAFFSAVVMIVVTARYGWIETEANGNIPMWDIHSPWPSPTMIIMSGFAVAGLLLLFSILNELRAIRKLKRMQ